MQVHRLHAIEQPRGAGVLHGTSVRCRTGGVYTVGVAVWMQWKALSPVCAVFQGVPGSALRVSAPSSARAAAVAHCDGRDATASQDPTRGIQPTGHSRPVGVDWGGDHSPLRRAGAFFFQ